MNVYSIPHITEIFKDQSSEPRLCTKRDNCYNITKIRSDERDFHSSADHHDYDSAILSSATRDSRRQSNLAS